MTDHPRNTRVRVRCPEVSARLVEAASAATSGCGKCHYWRPDGPWTAEHPLVVPPGGRGGAHGPSGASQGLFWIGSHETCAGSHLGVREVPLLAPRWPVDGRTPAGGPPGGGRGGAHGPSGASQGLSSVFWPRSREPVVVIAGNGPRTAGRSGPPVRHSGKAEGEKVLLSWGFSVTDPDSGTADLASTTAWVNDH